MSEKRLSLRGIETLARIVLSASGASGLQLDTLTSSIVDAEADGIRTVGLGFLSIYCEQLRSGKIDGRAVPEAREIKPSHLTINAKNGFAHAAFLHGLESWCEMAERQGTATLTISHSNSAGVLGWFVEKVARRGLICLAFANASAMMPPVGGNKPFHGTNPLAFACPRRSPRPPLVIDLATSQTAYVTIKQRADAGESIPENWGLDANAQPTTDPNDVVNGGMVAPLGGEKGALLALMVDILAGGLAGPNFSYQAGSLITGDDEETGIGQCFIAIAPPNDHFAERVEALLEAMSEAGTTRLPGQRRIDARVKAEQEGVSVPDKLLEALERYTRQ